MFGESILAAAGIQRINAGGGTFLGASGDIHAQGDRERALGSTPQHRYEVKYVFVCGTHNMMGTRAPQHRSMP